MSATAFKSQSLSSGLLSAYLWRASNTSWSLRMAPHKQEPCGDPRPTGTHTATFEDSVPSSVDPQETTQPGTHGPSIPQEGVTSQQQSLAQAHPGPAQWAPKNSLPGAGRDLEGGLWNLTAATKLGLWTQSGLGQEGGLPGDLRRHWEHTILGLGDLGARHTLPESLSWEAISHVDTVSFPRVLTCLVLSIQSCKMLKISITLRTRQ